MTLIHEYDGSTVANAVALVTEKNFSARAAIGEVDTIRVFVDDPTGSLTFLPFKVWRMIEDAAPAGNQTAWYGFVGDQVVSREGGEVAYRTDPGRVWELELHEANGFATRRLIVTGTKRPSETVDERLTWLLTQPGFTGIVFDHGLVAAFSQVMDEKDYLNQTGADVLRDCSLISGANFFLRYNEANVDLELAFYDAVTSPLDTSVLRISNDDADLTLAADGQIVGDTFPPNPGAKWNGGSGRVASGVAVAYDGGSYFKNDAGTEAEFGAVDQVAPTPQVNTRTSAIALTTHLLAQHSEQDERITDLRLQLPAARLNELLAGQLLVARFTHFPGWGSGRYARAAVRSFGRPAGETQAIYDVDLELVPAAPEFPVPCGVIVQTVSSGYSSVDTPEVTIAAPTPGNHLVFMISRRGPFNGTQLTPHNFLDTEDYPLTQFAPHFHFQNPASPQGMDPTNHADAIMAWREATGDETDITWDQTQQSVTVYEVEGGSWASFDVQSSSGNIQQTHGALPSVGGTGQLCFAMFNSDTRYPGFVDPVADAGWTEDDAHGSNVVGGAVAEPWIQHMHGTGAIVPGAVFDPETEWGAMAVAIGGDCA
jgi:hypothetical protein